VRPPRIGLGGHNFDLPRAGLVLDTERGALAPQALEFARFGPIRHPERIGQVEDFICRDLSDQIEDWDTPGDQDDEKSSVLSPNPERRKPQGITLAVIIVQNPPSVPEASAMNVAIISSGLISGI
jgi:hypothetical protein